MSVRLVALTVAALLLAPSAAHASAMTVANRVLLYTAAPGEVNQVTFTVGSNAADQLTLTALDSRNPIRLSGSCSYGDATRRLATCAYPVSGADAYVVLRLGDRADRALIILPSLRHGVRVFDGPGDDVVRVRGGYAQWINSAGRDYFFGGPGPDQITLGYGDDVILGGGGNDLLYGGRGADRIGGGFGNDRIVGGSGNDRLYGGPGNDRIWSGLGTDLVFGGPGFDLIDGRRGERRRG